MSLINQMLKDLEQRRSRQGGAEAYELLHDVQAVPELEASSHLRTLALGGLLLVLMGGGWWGYGMLAAPSVPPLPVRQVVAPLPVVPPSLPEPVAAEETAAPVVAVPAQVEPAAAVEPLAPPQRPAPAKPKAVRRVASVAPGPAAVAPPVAVTKVARPLSPEEQAEAAFQRAQAAQRSGQAAPMETELRRALRLDPSHLQAREILGSLLFRSGRLDEAGVVLREGISENAAPVSLRKVLARVLVDQGKAEDAVLALLLGGAPPVAQDLEYHQLLAAMYQRTGQYAAAAATYGRLLGVQPQVGVWWLGLGLALESDDSTDSAQQAYRKALEDRALQTGLDEFIRKRLASLAAGGGR